MSVASEGLLHTVAKQQISVLVYRVKSRRRMAWKLVGTKYIIEAYFLSGTIFISLSLAKEVGKCQYQ